MTNATCVPPSTGMSCSRRKMAVAAMALLAKCVLATAAFAGAAESGSHSAWQAVVNLPSGITVDVKARTRHIHCSFISATDAALTCTRDKAGTPIVIDRNDILFVKIGHRGRSALIGAGIGGGALAISAFAATSNPGDTFFGPNFLRGEATGLGAVAGGVIGGSIGALTDFSKSTVYSIR